MGPAALTTIIHLVNTYGLGLAMASLLANVLIVLGVFSRAGAITSVLGHEGSKAVAKVAALFMSAIAVMMVRSGIEGMLRLH